jgi:hypothetical protein
MTPRRFVAGHDDFHPRWQMTKIDIDRLSEAELVDLNHRVVERLRFLQQMRAHAEMLEFSIGDRVCFHAGGHGVVEGMLTRYNRKTVTVIADGGRHWNVSPSLLRRAGSFETATADQSNVIRLK